MLARALDGHLPAALRGMRRRAVAVLRSMPCLPEGAPSAMVPPMRTTEGDVGPSMPRLSASRDRHGSRTVPVRRACPPGDPPVEVLGVARRGSGAVVGDDRGRRVAQRRGGDVGAARTAATRRARVRPGARPGHGRGTSNGDALRGPAHQGFGQPGRRPNAMRSLAGWRCAERSRSPIASRCRHRCWWSTTS